MHWLFCLLLFAGLGELGIGVLQCIHLFLHDLPYTGIRGTLDNPGPYSFVVVMILPIAWWYLLSLRQRNGLRLVDRCSIWLSALYVALSCVVLPLCMSRASWIAALVACGAVSFSAFAGRVRTSRMLLYAVLVTAGLLLLGVLFYGLKRDSADGRILIWKVSNSLLKDHWVKGVGPGNFAMAYGEAQEEYFRRGCGSEREKYLAGAPEYAYNEYLQIWLEFGCVGLLCTLAAVGLLLYGLVRSARCESRPVLGCLVSVLIVSFFSYPLRNLTTCLLVVGFLLLATYLVWMEKCRKGIPILILVAAAIIFYGICESFVLFGSVRRAKEQWKSLQTYYNNGQFETVVSYYAVLHPFLNNNPEYLFEYGKCLFHTGEYDRSIRVLEEGLAQSSDPMFLNIIGRNYQSLGDFSRAEKCYWKARWRIPHRLYPLYRLMHLYQDRNEHAKAVNMARTILRKEVKVASPVDDRIFCEARAVINNLSNAPISE